MGCTPPETRRAHRGAQPQPALLRRRELPQARREDALRARARLARRPTRSSDGRRTRSGLYVAASLALIVTPGQDMIYVMTRSLAQGRLAGLCSAVGVCLGILVHTALAALGVGAILQASEGLFFALKLAGAAYLVYLGVRMLLTRAAPPRAARRRAARSRPRALVWQGMLSNVTNPKIVLFFFAFLPQFVDPGERASDARPRFPRRALRPAGASGEGGRRPRRGQPLGARAEASVRARLDQSLQRHRAGGSRPAPRHHRALTRVRATMALRVPISRL